MKPYTQIPGLTEVVLEESFVLAISATPCRITFDVDFVLTPSHPAYVSPLPNENEAYRRGQVRFVGVSRLVWTDQGTRPATDAAGEVDYGHIDDLRWDGHTFELEGDWGSMIIEARDVEVEV